MRLRWNGGGQLAAEIGAGRQVSCGPLHAIQPARPYRARREPVTDPSGSEEQVLWVFVPIMQVLGRVMT
jgi:hypothetical protein